MRPFILLPKWKNRYSMQFDGVNEYININGVGTALATTTIGTWSFWVRPVDATPDVYAVFICFANGNSTDMIQTGIDITTGKFWASVWDNNIAQWALYTDAIAFSDNTWTHLMIVQDGTSPILYVNASAVAQTFTTTTDKTFWFNNLVMNNGRIAARFYATGADGQLPFYGNIDEVAFFNTNLTATQRIEIYNGGKPKNVLKHSATSNLVSYFRMGDGDTNSIIYDKKGTNNGTPVNMEANDIVAVVP